MSDSSFLGLKWFSLARKTIWRHLCGRMFRRPRNLLTGATRTRFSSGEDSVLLIVQELGRIWHYKRVPIGASIAADEEYIMPPIAGTLGVYIRDPVDAGSKYALTAGHVARASPSRPYHEATKSIGVAGSRALNPKTKR